MSCGRSPDGPSALEFDDVDDPCVEVPDPEGNNAGFDVMAVTDVDP